MKKILILCCSLFVLTACENRLSDLEQTLGVI